MCGSESVFRQTLGPWSKIGFGVGAGAGSCTRRGLFGDDGQRGGPKVGQSASLYGFQGSFWEWKRRSVMASAVLRCSLRSLQDRVTAQASNLPASDRTAVQCPSVSSGGVARAQGPKSKPGLKKRTIFERHGAAPLRSKLCDEADASGARKRRECHVWCVRGDGRGCR